MTRYLLDCTLRDGGYVNDWKFGREHISYLFTRQVSSGVDVIEVGFLDERRPFDPDRTIMPDTNAVNLIFGRLDSCQALKVAMIDYGTCAIERLQPCQECWLDGIRVIFKKEVMREAIEFCKKVRALGYLIFVQAVSITSYNEDELRDLIALVNDLQPYAMSMVDTYGLLEPEGLLKMIPVVDKCLSREIILGYHAHNNFQLGYANSITMLNSRLNRNILVDGTLYGMGKSAGNAPIELIAMYMNRQFGVRYDVTQMQEAIVSGILDIYAKQPWGYTLFYYIAAANKCHPNYVAYLMNRRTLSITAVNEILRQLPESERLNKNERLIERLYLDYQCKYCDDTVSTESLRQALSEKSVLILGPGASIATRKQRISEYIENISPIIVSINFIPESYRPDYLFLTNSLRYLQMTDKLSWEEYASIPIIATSNVTRTGGKFPYVVNYSRLLDDSADIPDNSMIMLLKFLREIGVKEVALAGFDGYTADDVNYYEKKMEYGFIREKAQSLNGYARRFLKEYERTVSLTFVTDSYYLHEQGDVI